MEYKVANYSNVLPDYLENSESITKSRYDTATTSDLEKVLASGTPNKNEGFLERMFSDKTRTSKATAKAILDEISLREKLGSHLRYKIDEDISKHQIRLENLNYLKFYSFELEKDRGNRKNQLENNVLIGKGRKKRMVWINSTFKKLCHQYLRHKQMFGYEIHPDSFLLNNIKACKISKRALQKFFKSLLKKAGLPDYYYIHCLRHTYTTFLLKASNHNYRFAQQQLGHASIKTTQVYAGIINSEGKRAVEKLYK